MPVIVPPEAFDFWLDPEGGRRDGDDAVIQPALRMRRSSPTRFRRAVIRTANDSAELVEPLREPEPVAEAPGPKRVKKEKQDDRQGSLF